jgi:ArsR family transcriptional regulator
MESTLEMKLTRLAGFFKALGDETRLKILYFIKDGEKCQCEIVSHIGLSQPAVSRHMQLLVYNGLLKLKRKENKRFYSLTEDAKRVLFGEAVKGLLE